MGRCEARPQPWRRGGASCEEKRGRDREVRQGKKKKRRRRELARCSSAGPARWLGRFGRSSGQRRRGAQRNSAPGSDEAGPRERRRGRELLRAGRQRGTGARTVMVARLGPLPAGSRVRRRGGASPWTAAMAAPVMVQRERERERSGGEKRQEEGKERKKEKGGARARDGAVGAGRQLQRRAGRRGGRTEGARGEAVWPRSDLDREVREVAGVSGGFVVVGSPDLMARSG